MPTNTQYLNTKAKISYTASTGGTVNFNLAVPLRDQLPAYRVTRYVRDSMDFRTRTVFVISSTQSTGTFEWVGSIRYNKDRHGLIKMLKNGLVGQTLTYYKTTSSTGEACYMIEPDMDAVTAVLDRQRAGYNDVEVTLRLRKTSLALWSTKAL